ncbi:hypothetical protein B9N43_10580 [Denitratisoma sp. DHT3]|uniref:Tudor-knot domain-containing protein n=1 Tax=Denitratisoma sp. DHT3 TaxID=1981880 RepID=UPI001198B276|nr:Tudor-knot domain-containing protein [Denitratisoma sp. DHT3]QDX81659.1 hypothetical protein B9N43_10580 [Denitratisoma sp. DHT3]
MKKTILMAALGLASSLTATAQDAAKLPRASDASAAGCQPGKAVSVRYAGTWYPAKVLRGPDKTGTCLVSYDGFGSNWDEWVGADRMRPATQSATAPAKSMPESAGFSTDTVPPGKYACYTFDSGQLNYAYTDIVIEPGNRYAVGGKSGSYSLSGNGTLGFTGPMANAHGRFSLKSGGKPQIDLVFNGDARSSMTCPRT